MSAVLSARSLRKTYLGGDGQPLEILTGVDLDVAPGEFVAIVGASGAGKSTLLHLLGALDRPTAGTIMLDGQDLATLTRTELGEIRNRSIGFVFQFHHLLRDFDAVENVALPMRIAGVPPREARSRAEQLLTQVGLGTRFTHRPPQLSGGEQQRVAVARALANDPRVVLADEPSGNLDAAHAGGLHDILASLARDFETALVVVTHNRQLAARADRLLSVEGGRLVPLDRVEVET
ncbi:MAG: ABC transporter ATP-binding protein [Gemmatimonadota bacterium]|nr:ABC transporter ATP-binding protein [Gemmatimonadota bacterium]MDH5284794.1 ABC transporter ATP-binding protein [Gemmatimonadota bacterium]